MSTFAQELPSDLRTDTLYICERSIHTSFQVFTKMLDLSPEELFMLKEIYSGYAEKFPVKGIIFIQSSVEECLRRVRSRNHDSDELLSFEYLTKIQEKYMEWFANTDFPVFFVSDLKIKKMSTEEIISEALEMFKNQKYNKV